MFAANFRVVLGIGAAALVALACNDTTIPIHGSVHPIFSTLASTPACFRTTGDGRIDQPEPPTPSPQPKNSGKDYATFEFDAKPTACNSTDGSGDIKWTDHSPSAPGHGFKFKGTITSFSTVQDHYYPDRVCARFSGTGRAKAKDGSFDQDVSFTVDHACDEGEPGKGRDHIRMILGSGFYDRAGILTGGNIHQHRLKGGGGATTGNLTVSNTTTGSSFPTSYTVTVDAGAASATSQPMAPDGSVTFTGLPAGSHSVALAVASNCAVTSPNPQAVNVPAGGTATASFTVSCTTPPGNLMVSNTTTGSSFPTSYTVTVDQGTASATSQPMVPNGSVTFTGLPAGSHSVALTVASNCAVTSSNPQTVNVPAGGTATTSFTVSCSASSSGVEISGTGQIGSGSPTVGNDVQTFNFDVRSDLTGHAVFKDYGASQSDGSPITATVDHTADPATGITSFSSSFSSSSDPAFSSCTSDASRGVEFDAIARINDAPGSLLHFHVVACDNGSAGSGLDFFGFRIQENGFTRSGFLTSGDIVKSSF